MEEETWIVTVNKVKEKGEKIKYKRIGWFHLRLILAAAKNLDVEVLEKSKSKGGGVTIKIKGTHEKCMEFSEKIHTEKTTVSAEEI